MKQKANNPSLAASIQQYTQGRSPSFPPSGRIANQEDRPSDILADQSGALQNTGPTDNPQNAGQDFSDTIQ